MKTALVLALLVAVIYAIEDAQPVENSADLGVDEYRLRGYGAYYHSRPHYGGYYGHFRGRRSADEITFGQEADQSVDEHRYNGWGGHYRGWGGHHGCPQFEAYYSHNRGRRSADEVGQSTEEHHYRGYRGYYRPYDSYYVGHHGSYYDRPYWG